MNKNAIIVYVDNTEKCITEFSWLWKSWAMWDIHEEWDLVVCTHPAIYQKISNGFPHENMIVMEQPDMGDVDPYWKEHNFVNSFSMFEHSANLEVFNKYENLFRTECGTFLTQHFKGFEPWKDKVYFGVGIQYKSNNDFEILPQVRDKIRLAAKELKLPYRDISNVGSSVICNTEKMKVITRLQFMITKYLLNRGWAQGSRGSWPGWYKGMAHVYAHDLAINAYTDILEVQQGSLDIWCGSNKITKLDLHIRTWDQTQDNFFNKRKFHAGELPRMKFGKIPLKAGEYCLLVANEDLDYLKMCAKKSS